MAAETETWRDRERERQREAEKDDSERLGFDNGQTDRWRDRNL